MSDYATLYQRLGYSFRDEALLHMALSHRSCVKVSNERLEFLGDSLLGFFMAAEIYKRHPQMAEGEMSRLRSSLVNGDVLAELALELGLDRHLRLGQGEEKSGGRQRPSILADALEAMIAAIYLDANESTCRECVLRWFAARLQKSGQRSQRKDAKSALQEWMQAHRYPLPVYTVVATEGQAHEQVFRVRCVVEGLAHESFGEASSRRRAEQMAAEKYLELINGRK